LVILIVSSLTISSVTSLCLSPEGDTVYSVSQDSSLKIYSLSEKKQVSFIFVLFIYYNSYLACNVSQNHL
jgi:WD40 repeat protein